MNEESRPDTNMYLLLGEMKGMLATALGGIENLKEDQKEHKEETDHRLNRHSDRITRVEQFQWKTIGIVGAAIVVIPVVLTVIQMFVIK